MTGITPPEFTRSGRWVDCPPMILRPTTRLAYCTGMRRSLRSTKTMNATTAIISTTSNSIAGTVKAPQAWDFDLLPEVDDAARQAHHDAGEDQQRHAIADAALGDLLAQPHDEDAARGEGQHRHQDETDAGIVDESHSAAQRLPLQGDGNAQRLHRAQQQGEITRPLGDLLASQLAFLLQLGQRLVHHGHQLQDDGRRNVRHDAQRKDRQPAQLAAAEQIDEAKEAAAVLVEELRQLVGVDTRRRNVSAEAVHRQQAQA